MDELECIRRSQAGDLEAFNRLVEAYQVRAYNLALRMLGSAPLAEDATQDAFISAFRNVRAYRGGSFRAWLFRIVANACYDQLRLKKRHAAASLEELAEGQGWQPAARGRSPEEHAISAELGREIALAVAGLSRDQRLILTLADIEGLSYEEVAQAACVSLGTVKSRLSRARARVRDHFADRRELLPAGIRLDT